MFVDLRVDLWDGERDKYLLVVGNRDGDEEQIRGGAGNIGASSDHSLSH
jgi:hypothetical protein